MCNPGSRPKWFACFWCSSSQWARDSSFTMFLDHTQRRTTVGRTALDEWSTCRRDLYLTEQNTDNKQTSMPPVGFEPITSAGERPHIYALERAATGVGKTTWCELSCLNIVVYCMLLTRRLGFEPRTVHFGFLVHKVTHERVLSESFCFLLAVSFLPCSLLNLIGLQHTLYNCNNWHTNCNEQFKLQLKKLMSNWEYGNIMWIMKRLVRQILVIG
jgi:hypothetical protein